MATISNILLSASQALGNARTVLSTSIVANALVLRGAPSLAEQNVNAERVFSHEEMRNYIGTEIPGANDPKLNELLEGLLTEDDPAKVDQSLREIAEIRGVSYEDLKGDYDVYQEYLANVPIETSIELNKHPDFLGSTESLRYGDVVGSVLGVDPVFGSLLNPTGGIVGPGNTQLYDGPAENALAYHGIFHDAAGYLTKHDVGPGYTYLGDDIPFFDGPEDGQKSGSLWWQKEFAAVAINETVGEIRREGAETITEVIREGNEGNREISAEQAEGRREVSERVENNDFVGAARESVEAQVEVNRERVEQRVEQGRELAEGAAEIGREATEGAKETVETVTDTVGGLGRGIWGAVT